MADPEQIYQEVLQEEQQKGVSSVVAEGRAKAARVRAESGSPHPKEPKWWPGAQPHIAGDGMGEAAPAAAAPAVEEAPTAEAPAAEAPTEEVPAAEAPVTEEAPAEPAPAPAEAPPAQPAPAPAEAPAAQPAPAQPAPAPQPAQPAQQPAAQAQPAQPAAVAPQQPEARVITTPTIGVRHGTATGTRLRPEDAVGTEAQFDGERAMVERRRLIEELTKTGVPAVTAARAGGGSRAGWLAILYLLVPLLVVFFIANQEPTSAPAPGGNEPQQEQPAGNETGGGSSVSSGDTLVASGTAFDAQEITLQAGEQASITLENQDPFVHNVAIYESEQEAQGGEALETSPDVQGSASETWEFEAPQPGEYYFQCDYHPTMSGTVVVQ